METERPQPIVIPHGELSAEALRGVLESFVLREGTDYGEREFSLEQKVAHVLRHSSAARRRSSSMRCWRASSS